MVTAVPVSMWENPKERVKMRIGWMEYIRGKNIVKDVNIYLSLGSKEERTKNPLMSTVGDCTRETYELLKRNPAVKKTALQWNKEGHFADADARLVKWDCVAFASAGTEALKIMRILMLGNRSVLQGRSRSCI
ncbi:MAG: hypothetical protein LUG54_02455 [Clostridiales bacterium]|nr:hypothetical protein [Clostridiales bacterium]